MQNRQGRTGQDGEEIFVEVVAVPKRGGTDAVLRELRRMLDEHRGIDDPVVRLAVGEEKDAVSMGTGEWTMTAATYQAGVTCGVTMGIADCRLQIGENSGHEVMIAKRSAPGAKRMAVLADGAGSWHANYHRGEEGQRRKGARRSERRRCKRAEPPGSRRIADNGLALFHSRTVREIARALSRRIL